ncbi:cytochrome P450 [Sandaracinobacteroides saxicola]|uniref:Cytochrome P450 n=1 Tax=Sandaracinobacteroides saxicola TaxID=2759707 RepID=A0A7G5IJI0_9SPHN|nr:cytochrome P450 [Sandaracinobacteroides saxicola]QMW23522.1 cytochrome P450 [Sandaracinobacteroides saxicola]
MATAALAHPPIDLLDTSVFARRQEAALFRRLRDRAPPFWNPEPGGQGFWNLTRHADVVTAARDNRRLGSGRGTQIKDKRAEGHGHPSVHNADQPIHGPLRAPGLDAFRRAAMARHGDRIATIVDRLIDAAPVNRPFDFVETIALQLPMIVIAEVLGVPDADAPQLTRWANAMSDVHATDTEQAEARAALFRYFRTLADGKRLSPADDVASALAGHFDGPHRDEILDAYFMLLTVAGNETTRFLLAEGLEALVETPGALDRLRADPTLVGSCVEEMCRFVSPVLQMRRTAMEDMTLCDQPIRAGDKVVLWFNSANRDERVFADPDIFDPGRHPNPHVGFGAGAHFCIGAHLARLETRLFLESFLRRIARVAIVEPATRNPSNWFAATHRLMVEWA